jgi:hypothetical protein
MADIVETGWLIGRTRNVRLPLKEEGALIAFLPGRQGSYQDGRAGRVFRRSASELRGA